MKKAEFNKLNLMQIMEIILEKTNQMKLSPDNLQSIQPLLEALASRLFITEREALMLTAFINLCDDSRISFRDLARHFDCSNVKIQTYWPEIESLAEKGYVCIRKDGYLTFYVPGKAVGAIRENHPYVKESYENLSLEEWWDCLGDMLNNRDNGNLSYGIFTEELQRLIDNNPSLPIVQRLRSYQLDKVDSDTIILLAFADFFVRNSDDHIVSRDIEDITESRFKLRSITSKLEKGVHLLQQYNLVEFACSDGQVESNAWKLTDKAKEELLEGISYLKNIPMVGLTQPDAISEKKLYYCEEVTKQVNQLRSLLQEDRFLAVQKRLEDKGMRRGFACIFYGSPGTGKTETVLQLARETGRAIKMVDVPNLRSKWVGETEKNIKAVFEDYRRLCKDTKLAPILLFNEADAVLCKRNEGAVGSVDKMENAMQNIILQEMENLDGIMIATTNLSGNLDAAFERRFLYKIEFLKPTPNESKHIWSALLPDLDEKDALDLASTYSFSGGQIENIARKHFIDCILNEKEGLAIDAIREACRAEQFHNTSVNKIGFC